MSPHSYVRTSKSGKLNSKTEPDLATDYRNLAGGKRVKQFFVILVSRVYLPLGVDDQLFALQP